MSDLDNYIEGKNGGTIEICTDSKNEYRWQIRASNGNIIAVSGLGYKSKGHCISSLDNVKWYISNALIKEVN